MARRRYQKPEPRIEGLQWVLYYRDDDFSSGTRERKKKRHVLGPSTLPKREAEKLRDEFLRPMNQGLVPIGSAVNFADYVETIYKPVVLPTMAKSTRDRSMSVYENYLKPAFGGMRLRDTTALTVQQYVSSMATWKLSHESKDKVRDVLSSILGSAVTYKLLLTNPVEGVRLPAAKHGKRMKPYVTQEQFADLLNRVPEPYSTLLFTGAYTGLRPSELIALRWRCIHEDSITVEERCTRGDWGAPKSDASNATIPVPPAVIERLHRLKSLIVEVRAGRAVRRYQAVKSAGDDDLVFQSPIRGGTLRDNNILVRFIKPAARAIGLPWVNFQVLRRSYATWLAKKGAHPKDAQALMRHSRASTTLDIYQQFIPEAQRRIVDELVN